MLTPNSVKKSYSLHVMATRIGTVMKGDVLTGGLKGGFQTTKMIGGGEFSLS
jgi:hypothetical protein